MLEIAPEKVAHVIVKAREYDSKVATWDDSAKASDAEDDPSSILEDFADDPTRAELVGFINALNEDEQAHLVALAWIGRGTERVALRFIRPHDRHAAACRVSGRGVGEARHLRGGRRERHPLRAVVSPWEGGCVRRCQRNAMPTGVGLGRTWSGGAFDHL